MGFLVKTKLAMDNRSVVTMLYISGRYYPISTTASGHLFTNALRNLNQQLIFYAEPHQISVLTTKLEKLIMLLGLCANTTTSAHPQPLEASSPSTLHLIILESTPPDLVTIISISVFVRTCTGALVKVALKSPHILWYPSLSCPNSKK